MNNSLANWDGQSDVILISEDDNGLSIKICPADTLRKILREYSEFIDTHELVFDTKVTNRQMLVTARWEKKS